MFNFVLLLAVIGLSASFDRNGYRDNPNPYYRGWGYPGHSNPYQSGFPGSWHHHSGYLGGLGWFNHGNQHRNTQPPKPTHQFIPYPSIGYYSDSDHQSDSYSGSEGNASGDEQEYPFSYHNSGSKPELPGRTHQSKTPGGAELNGNVPQQSTESMITFLNNPEPTTNRQTDNVGQITVTNADPGQEVQDESLNRDAPFEAGKNRGQIAVTNSDPGRDVQDESLNRNVPSEAGKNRGQIAVTNADPGQEVQDESLNRDAPFEAGKNRGQIAVTNSDPGRDVQDESLNRNVPSEAGKNRGQIAVTNADPGQEVQDESLNRDAPSEAGKNHGQIAVTNSDPGRDIQEESLNRDAPSEAGKNQGQIAVTNSDPGQKVQDESLNRNVPSEAGKNQGQIAVTNSDPGQDVQDESLNRDVPSEAGNNHGQIAITNSDPGQEVQDESLNRNVPSEAGKNQFNINITDPIDITSKLSDPLDKPVEKPSETNKTVNDAYITGPDDTLDRIRANQTSKVTTNTRPMDASKPSIIDTINEYPTTPAPSIGSIPVPSLGQFLAPSLQWNVGIYTKMETPYSQICGGSLVKSDAVLSAAHCFWSDDVGLLRPALFAVAAGKLQRAWDAVGDAYAQQSDVEEIRIPPRFQGAMTSFQDDIAIVRLSTPFEYGPGVKPVCVNFDLALEREQLKDSRGTVVGWGLTEPNGPPSETLNVVRLPHLEINECIKQVPATFLKYITSDKICAGDFSTGFAACKGDSGGGLVYTTNNVPYIRGIVSTAPRSEHECNAFTPATFTHISAHAMFISENILNIAEDCPALYEEKTDGSTGTNVPNNAGDRTNVESEQMNVESDQMNVDSAITNVESGQTNVESDQTNMESGQINVVSDQTNMESGQTNIENGQTNMESGETNVESDQMNVDSAKTNVDSDKTNVESDQMNLDSAKTNVDSDQTNVDSAQTNVDSDKTKVESDNMNVTDRGGKQSNVPVPLPLILSLSPEEESNLSKCNLFLKLLGLQMIKLNTEPRKD